MKILHGILTFLLLSSFSVHAETDNFNMSLTGTFDNALPDNCSVSAPTTINMGTVSSSELMVPEKILLMSGGGKILLDTGIDFNIEVKCTVGTSFNLYPDFLWLEGQDVSVAMYDKTGSDILSKLESNLTGIGTGTSQEFTITVGWVYDSANPTLPDNGAFTLSTDFILETF